MPRSSTVEKIPWQGVLISVQPRIRLSRSFDQRSHTCLGYALRLHGGIAAREFLVGVGERAHARHRFRAGDTASGDTLPAADPRLETVEFYKVSDLRVSVGEMEKEIQPPPWRAWRGIPPPLSIYRERGHRRLAARAYEEKCTSCMWGCLMAVEMIIDQWNPERLHTAARTSKVPTAR
jgi:hypothetical protein